MIAHLKMLLNVSGIAKRNGRLPLVRAGKVCANTLISQLFIPIKSSLAAIQHPVTLPKLMRRLWQYAFSLCQQLASTMPL